jgi:hypothetical protein
VVIELQAPITVFSGYARTTLQKPLCEATHFTTA